MAPHYSEFREKLTGEQCLEKSLNEICAMDYLTSEDLQSRNFISLDFLRDNDGEIRPVALALGPRFEGDLPDVNEMKQTPFFNLYVSSVYCVFLNRVKNKDAKIFEKISKYPYIYWYPAGQDVVMLPVIGDPVSEEQVEKMFELAPDTDTQIYDYDFSGVF
ncbi:hypothetical protein K8R14_03355 [bacterium]|nr:hypothetical protein [bacterium]